MLGRRVVRIALIIAAAVAAGVLSLMPRFQWEWLTPGWRVGISSFCVLTVVICQVLAQSFGRKGAMKRFLNSLHGRLWSGQNGGRDPDYRVAFFAPILWHPSRLACYYRTDGRSSKKTWSKEPPPGRDGDGVVGHIWIYGMDPNIRALPDVPTQEDVAEYIRLTHLEQKTYDNLSWKGAALRGAQVVTTTGSEPVGVLLIESRVCGAEIQLAPSFPSEVAMCGMVWEGWL